ncbi:hypothetical protein [Natronolimnobius baerhuensis]|uniref:Uncharacterized protein n=1 Tax=Natronolimnobius baerhuensis TaxID=253108 RepID=A0A202ECQ8_9EURY|nr:hypothetical protein [Natronolimnobius baerhuensis]OVE85790.1 hypothetical protein B2G88_02955 [Natronolimnobius baerhuensis]
MNRRAVLASVSATTASAIAGCSTPTSRTRPAEFDDCSQSIILAGNLPNPVVSEVETALESGQYQTPGDLRLQEVMGPNTTHIRVSGQYVEPRIDADDETTTLVLEESIPRQGDHELPIRNRTGEDIDAAITVTYQPPGNDGDPETIRDDRLELSVGESETAPEAWHRYGQYTLEIEFDDSDPLEESWSISQGTTLHGLTLESTTRVQLDLSVADIDPCRW